ncbi:hypothetical protein HYR99_32035 [Candidatus Poribacteria bacterium]|nr:hypothetical protein [Candidatus Poribacteria bacterium]
MPDPKGGKIGNQPPAFGFSNGHPFPVGFFHRKGFGTHFNGERFPFDKPFLGGQSSTIARSRGIAVRGQLRKTRVSLGISAI